MTKESDTHAQAQARRRHRIALWLLAGYVGVFLLVTSLSAPPRAVLTTLYLLLLGFALNAMWATMSVMINRRGHRE